jgi:hypothetical protein
MEALGKRIAETANTHVKPPKKVGCHHEHA